MTWLAAPKVDVRSWNTGEEFRSRPSMSFDDIVGFHVEDLAKALTERAFHVAPLCVQHSELSTAFDASQRIHTMPRRIYVPTMSLSPVDPAKREVYDDVEPPVELIRWQTRITYEEYKAHLRVVRRLRTLYREAARNLNAAIGGGCR